MKKIFLLRLVSLLCLSSAHMHAEEHTAEKSAPSTPLKLGYVDMESIVQALPEVKEVEAELGVFQQQLAQQTEEKQAELEQAVNAIIKQGEAHEVSDEENQKVQQLQQGWERLQRESPRRYMRKQAELYQPLYDRVRYAIAQVAQEHGYSYVFNHHQMGGPFTALLHVDEGHDLSDLVREQLGIVPAEEMEAS